MRESHRHRHDCPNGAVSNCGECGLPCGLRGALCTLPLLRSAFHLLHRCNTRYGWLVRPYPVGTSTLQETPSFAWRTNAGHQARPEAGARHERTLEGVACMPWLGDVCTNSTSRNYLRSGFLSRASCDKDVDQGRKIKSCSKEEQKAKDAPKTAL